MWGVTVLQLRALETLHALGALDRRGDLTKQGRTMADFPLDPQYSLMLLRSVEFGCSEEAITMVAMLSAENIFTMSNVNRAEAEAAHKQFAHVCGDHLTLLQVWRMHENVRTGNRGQGGVAAWCRTNSINDRSMKKAADVRKQLRLMCERKSIPLVSCGDELDSVRKCLAAGLFLNCAVRGDGGTYVTLMDHQEVSIHPSSVLKNVAKKPSHLIFSEVRASFLILCTSSVLRFYRRQTANRLRPNFWQLVLTTKQYLRDVTAIEASWLLEFSPHYFRKRKDPKNRSSSAGFRVASSSSSAVDRSMWGRAGAMKQLP